MTNFLLCAILPLLASHALCFMLGRSTKRSRATRADLTGLRQPRAMFLQRM